MAFPSEMSQHVRCVVAFVAWRLITGDEGECIYDHSQARKIDFSGMISDTKINLQDDSGRQISGSGGSGMYTILAGSAAKPVTLKIDGRNFEGFDYGAGLRYRGEVDREKLSILEGTTDSAYAFSVERGLAS